MTKNYSKAVRLIKLYPELIGLKLTPCSEEVINSAEALLNVKFPYTYRLFLKCFGRLDFGCSSLMGIFENNLKKSEMIDYTLNVRENYEMPKNFVVIDHPGIEGQLICLQIDLQNPNQSPVVSFFHPEVPVSVLEPDFGSYFLYWVKLQIDTYHDMYPYAPRKTPGKSSKLLPI